MHFNYSTSQSNASSESNGTTDSSPVSLQEEAWAPIDKVQPEGIWGYFQAKGPILKIVATFSINSASQETQSRQTGESNDAS